MNKASTTPGLFQRLLARPPSVAVPDAADLGTAFGLELALDPAMSTPVLIDRKSRNGNNGWMKLLNLRSRGTP